MKPSMTSYTDNPVCPHCGHVDKSARFQLVDGDEDYNECDSCEKTYIVMRHVSIHYTTRVEP